MSDRGGVPWGRISSDDNCAFTLGGAASRLVTSPANTGSTKVRPSVLSDPGVEIVTDSVTSTQLPQLFGYPTEIVERPSDPVLPSAEVTSAAAGLPGSRRTLPLRSSPGSSRLFGRPVTGSAKSSDKHWTAGLVTSAKLRGCQAPE
jgi:hypothetical protein